jgi:tetratricopeptide (TPR) repeat protein
MPFFPKGRSLISILGIILIFFLYFFREPLSPPRPVPQEINHDPIRPIEAPLPALLSPRPITPPDLTALAPPPWVSLNEQGLSYFNGGHYQEALLLFSQAFEQNRGEEILQKNVAQAHAQLGWEEVSQKRFGEALSHFESAIQFFSREPSYHLGKAVSLFRMQKEEAAVQSLQAVLALNPNDATAYKIWGEIAYSQNAFEKAREVWEKAVRLDPEDRVLTIRLEKIKGEVKLFSKFQSEGTGRFTLLFEGGEDRDEGRRVLHLLENAYREIGQHLSYYPGKPIFAVLYSDQKFRDITRSPAWTKGLFDGRIHLPIGGTIQNETLLKKLIYHEYTHALLHQLSQGKTPTWLNEGLALFFEEGDREGRPHRFVPPLIPLEALHGSFIGYDEPTAHLAYEESRSATGYLMDRYGLFRIKLLLERLATASSFSQLFEETFMIRYADFQREWQNKVVQES